MIGSDGKKRLAPHQLANLDETCMRMLSKMSPVLAMKGAPKALRAEHKNYRESQTLLLTIFADGVARVPPFLIVDGSEGDEGTFSQPAWWGTRDNVNMLKGTMMEHSAIAQQKNAYMTNQMFVTWTLDSGLHTGARCAQTLHAYRCAGCSDLSPAVFCRRASTDMADNNLKLQCV